MGMGAAARRNILSISSSKIYRFCRNLSSLSNQAHHLPAKANLAHRHHHHRHHVFVAKGILNLLPKLDAVDSAYSKSLGKQRECAVTPMKPFLVSSECRYNTKRVKTMFSVICRDRIIPPGLSWKILVNSLTSNRVLSPEVLGAHALKGRSISTNFEKESLSEAKKELPTNLDDFQHEEIVGPTVEKDLSTIANEFRDCLKRLSKSMSNLASALKALALLQLGVALWCGIVVSPDHHTLILTNILGATIAIMLAYLLRQAQQSMLFFSKLEERSRLRIITLSVQVVKAFLEFTGRSNGVIRLVSAGVFITLLVDIGLLYGKQFL